MVQEQVEGERGVGVNVGGGSAVKQGESLVLCKGLLADFDRKGGNGGKGDDVGGRGVGLEEVEGAEEGGCGDGGFEDGGFVQGLKNGELWVLVAEGGGLLEEFSMVALDLPVLMSLAGLDDGDFDAKDVADDLQAGELETMAEATMNNCCRLNNSSQRGVVRRAPLVRRRRANAALGKPGGRGAKAVLTVPGRRRAKADSVGVLGRRRAKAALRVQGRRRAFK
ncbi:hypothetical protein CYMTET_41684 [Cymbomonas tetramitiformis]|uniref:Uncharacterized protein n=1 Tax=Cymbomonas tetramitiformis TaxID=36881 RepID=A0AAE0C7K1_9CHLO|nr:hypothetical protein CYMTET_41684 [Cymbomonas tetramitiformis]